MTEREKTRTTQGPVAEWPIEKLEEHREMLEGHRSEIQERIDAIDEILNGRDRDTIRLGAQWCPHNESFNLCQECAAKWLPIAGGKDDEQ